MCGPCEGGCFDVWQGWDDEARYNADMAAIAQAEAEAQAQQEEAQHDQ